MTRTEYLALERSHGFGVPESPDPRYWWPEWYLYFVKERQAEAQRPWQDVLPLGVA